MGYGSRALKLLSDYFTGKLTSLDETAKSKGDKLDAVSMATNGSEGEGLMKETISPRTHLPPLLTKLSERPPESLDYIGVSYGLTASLYKLVTCCEINSALMYSCQTGFGPELDSYPYI